MDQAVLVANGRALVDDMSAEGMQPRAAIWINNVDTGNWKLWIVPPENMTDKREFYRRAATLISREKSKISHIDIADVEMASATHPAIIGLSQIARFDGGAMYMSGNTFNGFYIPEAIILRSMI